MFNHRQKFTMIGGATIQDVQLLISFKVYLETNESNKIYQTTFWCYFHSHGNITRMSNIAGRKRKEEMKKIPVTITHASGFKRINKKAQVKYQVWMSIHKFWKQLPYILDVIPKEEITNNPDIDQNKQNQHFKINNRIK